MTGALDPCFGSTVTTSCAGAAPAGAAASWAAAREPIPIHAADAKRYNTQKILVLTEPPPCDTSSVRPHACLAKTYPGLPDLLDVRKDPRVLPGTRLRAALQLPFPAQASESHALSVACNRLRWHPRARWSGE